MLGAANTSGLVTDSSTCRMGVTGLKTTWARLGTLLTKAPACTTVKVRLAVKTIVLGQMDNFYAVI